MRNEQVRYSYGSGSGNRIKNTLVTLVEGSTIYFGIARCNEKSGDIMKKERGRNIAWARADLARTEGSIPVRGILFHDSGMRGACNAEDVQSLIGYFEDVDFFMAEEQYPGSARPRLSQLAGFVEFDDEELEADAVVPSGHELVESGTHNTI